MNFSLQDETELTNLISIRSYVANSIALPAIDKKTVNELNGILLLLDEKIIGILLDKPFKNFVGYNNVQDAKKRAANITNIYAGVKDREQLKEIHETILNRK